MLRLLWFVACAAAACQVYDDLRILRALDGDTVALDADFLPAPLDLSLRIRGVDCPESGHRARCPEEAAMAAAATRFTAAHVADQQPVAVEICGWDKYGGRVSGDILISAQRLSALLLAAGHAVAYTGRGAKHDWCACAHNPQATDS